MIRNAEKQAHKSQFKYRVGAVLVRSGRVLSTGHNKVGHRSKQRIWESVHAEESAIVNALKSGSMGRIPGSILYVVRILSDGSLSCAKPCTKCNALIQSVGIKKVVYTDWDGSTVVERM